MTETKLNPNTQKKKKIDILMILAYVLFLYIAVCDSYLILDRLSYFIIKANEPTSFVRFTIFIKYIPSLIYYCLAIVIFFKYIVLKKPLRKWFKYFLYIFILLNAVNIIACLDFIHLNTYDGIWTGMFNYAAGASLFNLIFIIAFLRYSSDNSKFIKLLSNKWLVFSIIAAALLFIIYETYRSYNIYIGSLAYNAIQQAFSEAFNTSLNSFKAKFPFIQFSVLLSYLLSTIIFLFSLIRKKRVAKLSLALIIVCIILLATSYIINEINQMDNDDSLVFLYLYPDYILLTHICIIIGMYRICNKEAISDELTNDTEYET